MAPGTPGSNSLIGVSRYSSTPDSYTGASPLSKLILAAPGLPDDRIISILPLAANFPPMPPGARKLTVS